jgi:hypothetical protein
VPGTTSEVETDAGALVPTANPVASERVERPEPGLARGRWEAPASVFYGVAAVTLIGGVAVAIRGMRKPRR